MAWASTDLKAEKRTVTAATRVVEAFIFASVVEEGLKCVGGVLGGGGEGDGRRHEDTKSECVEDNVMGRCKTCV